MCSEQQETSTLSARAVGGSSLGALLAVAPSHSREQPPSSFAVLSVRARLVF